MAAGTEEVPLVEITLQGNPQLQVTGGSGRTDPLNYRTDFVGASYGRSRAVSSPRQRDRLRRLRHQRAGARLERLCRTSTCAARR